MEGLGTRLWKAWEQGYGRPGNEAMEGLGTRLCMQGHPCTKDYIFDGFTKYPW